MIINVQDVLRIEPKLEFSKPSTLNITCHLTEDQLEKLFYAIWDKVGNDKLNEWLEKEDMKLTHKL